VIDPTPAMPRGRHSTVMLPQPRVPDHPVV
jgi:hypothetical protein